MTVAVDKDQGRAGALPASFEAVAAKLPGGRAVTEARKAAIGTFAALGLPHRRIEAWKYTDLRNALKEALPPAVGGACQAQPQPTSTRRWKAWPALDAYRVVFVDGALSRRAFDRGRRQGAGDRVAGGGACQVRRPGRRWPDRRERRRPGGRDRAQHRVHDRRRGGRASPTAPSSTSRCCSCSPAPATEAAPRHHAQHRRARRRRACDPDRSPRRAAGRGAGPDQYAERGRRRRRRASHPLKCHAGRRARDPSGHLDGDARQGRRPTAPSS